MTRPKVEMHVIMKGEVQGVGFRAMAKRFARELFLTGFVRNLSDGTVEIVAQGDEEDLRKIVDRLVEYFGLDPVRGVEMGFLDRTEIFDDFQIRL